MTLADPDAAGRRAVLLDGRAAKSPAGRALALPVEPLARHVAGEWDAQEAEIDTAAMPATRLAFTVIDRGAEVREGLAEEAVRFAGGDLLCYFAEAPTALIAQQEAAWAPLLDWAADDLGVRLRRAEGIMHLAQPPEALARVRALALELDDFSLGGLAFAAALFGSTVLAFAVQRGRISGAEAHRLARTDEAFQEAQWGVDEEAAARTAARLAEAEFIDAWFAALR